MIYDSRPFQVFRLLTKLYRYPRSYQLLAVVHCVGVNALGLDATRGWPTPFQVFHAASLSSSSVSSSSSSLACGHPHAHHRHYYLYHPPAQCCLFDQRTFGTLPAPKPDSITLPILLVLIPFAFLWPLCLCITITITLFFVRVLLPILARVLARQPLPLYSCLVSSTSTPKLQPLPRTAVR